MPSSTRRKALDAKEQPLRKKKIGRTANKEEEIIDLTKHEQGGDSDHVPSPKSKTPSKTPASRKKRPAKQEPKSKPSPPPPISPPPTSILINRAPVLTLWYTTVAEVQGFTHQEALTYARWVSGIMAHSKGTSLGLFEDKEVDEEEKEEKKLKREEMGVQKVEIFNIKIPAILTTINSSSLLLAIDDKSNKAIDPASVERYLHSSFKDNLSHVKRVMKEAAEKVGSYEQLNKCAYKMYERFRPAWKGWGEKSQLYLESIADSWKDVNVGGGSRKRRS
jgi:hypothetical protein